MGGIVNIVGVPKFDNLELVKTGSTVISKPENDTGSSVIVAHNLGYKPVIFAYLDFGEFERHPLPFLEISNTGSDSGKIQVLIDVTLSTENEMYFGLQAPNWAANGWYLGSFDVDITYYLCRIRSN